MWKWLHNLCKPQGNPMCKKCNFFIACNDCSKEYHKIDKELKRHKL